ncbi:MAG: DNA mismatch repair protein MutS [Lachnospiraceae bacterium]|nr:DNA mismatch repair protein MutS [Lachnospiraceae bacterium]
MPQLTPMMQQYLQTKLDYQDCILFYRLGDFYEMFFDDAKIASKELELTLTGKDCGMAERAPMCGVPYHAVDGYLNKLVSKGYKVAIGEQMEDPKLAKGLVKREVIRIVTPGTNLDAQALDETRNNYLMCVIRVSQSRSGSDAGSETNARREKTQTEKVQAEKAQTSIWDNRQAENLGKPSSITDRYGVAVADISTGEFLMTELEGERRLFDEIVKFSPSELVCNQSFYMSGIDLEDMRERLGITVFSLDSWYFDDELCGKVLMEHFHVSALEGLGLADYTCGVTAAGALLKYLMETQKTSIANVTRLVPYSIGKYMVLDSSTRRNLELCETLREKKKRGSLLWVLDKTKTAMGARLMRKYVEQPLIEKDAINARLDAVGELKDNAITREELREYLNPIYDLERLISRISYQSANPRDMIAFKTSLAMLPPIKYIMKSLAAPLLKQLEEEIDELTDIHDLIERAIIDDPPIIIREGGIIKDGYNEEVDRLRSAKNDGKSWLAKLEAEEREKTGIKNLRIKFNKVFGYYLEVTNSFKDMVPEYYTRKQTLTNAERYITPELKELEDTILGAEDRLVSLEYSLYVEVRSMVAEQIERIQKTAQAIAGLDVFASLALVAERGNYVRPAIKERGVIEIKNGRHPVVEKMIPNDMFIPNDTCLDNGKNRISIITGPNMAGKSTYMRQSALIVLLAQIGSFVPATSAKIGLVDRIFTRVGASDDLASGQSTFMVEMTEVANILRNATKNSLLILDEIGRGTSTFDGLSIAWAVVEHISNPKLLGAKTLFATHYHELTELEGRLPGVNNYCIAVKEQGDDIVFLRKIVPGGADKSYGIQVARLAGVPSSVTDRAKELAEELSNADIAVQRICLPKDNKAGGLAVDADSSGETDENQPDGNPDRTSVRVQKPKKAHVKKPEPVELGQMTMLEAATDADILKELQELDVPNMTPMDALNTLYKMQSKLKNRWEK